MTADDIEWGLAELRARAPRYSLLTNYDAGNHRLGLASDKMRTAFRHLFTAFALNLCPRVVGSVADRLQIAGFSDPTAEGGMSDAAAATWDHSRMAQQAGRVHRDALVAGDAHIIVWPDDDGIPTIYPQAVGQVVARYSTSRPGQVIYAIKAWRDDAGRCRVTAYYPDAVLRYITPKAVDGLPERFTSLVPIDDDEPETANTWGTVPVFHLANGAAVGQPGTSELHDVIPLQDALNKSVIDIMVGSEFTALQQRWATGVEDSTDEFGRTEPLPVTPGSVLSVPDEAARFGEFGAGDLRQLIEVKSSFATDIAAVSATPLHELIAGTGGWPSGEALKTSEAPRVKKCADRITAWAPVWAEAMSLALRMGGADAPAVRAIYESPETRVSPLEQANTAIAKQAAGIPRQQTWREMGYSEDQIAKMEEDYQANQARSAEAAAAAFNRGAAA